ncbi:MAG: hypothetical protein K8I27_04375 [Planctomycetes bacterium]|nr:hypothetical protein [Planctomycetota bacterium]
MLVICSAACGNPRTNPPPENALDSNETTGPVERPAVSLRPGHSVGDKFRTTRALRVEELTETERYFTESEEVTLTEVLRVDDTGRLLGVRRAWELSVTRLVKGYGRGEEARGELDGCTLELTRRNNGVEAKVLAGNPGIRGANFLIEGFDTGLLPLDPVREGEFWVLEGGRLGGLNSFIEAMQFEIEKNKLTCQAVEISPSAARISMEWHITGKWQGAVAVLAFDGEFRFDRKSRMVTGLKLSGGRQGQRGAKQQIEIEVTRRSVQGWLDLDR